MIIEGIVTTRNPDGTTNVAPMGPEFDPTTNPAHLVLKPFQTSKTYQNLKATGVGVFHLTDDVLLLARATIGQVEPPLVRAAHVPCARLADATRAFEFNVTSLDDSNERARIDCRVVHIEELRPFQGLNRAAHAVVEAAILASRVGLLSVPHILGEMKRLVPLVEKTGSARDREGFRLLWNHVENAASPKCVRAASRLHFGFFSNQRASGRAFGGLGLMIESPAIEIIAHPGGNGQIVASPNVSAAIARRAEGLLEQLAHLWNVPRDSFPDVEILSSPPEHSGLGVGTQLSLSIAKLLGDALDRDLTAHELARLTKRGARSAIGIFGWKQGGLLVDPGEGTIPQSRAPLLRKEFPTDWSILVVRPPLPPGLHGALENRAIDVDLSISQTTTERLCYLALLEILPALEELDVARFGQKVAEYNRLVGECFASVQGGPFADPVLGAMVDWLGARQIGAGQSSWGPALFAFFASKDEAQETGRELANHFQLAPEHWLVTPAANHGNERPKPPAWIRAREETR